MKKGWAGALLLVALACGEAAAATPEQQKAYDEAFAAMMADVGNLDKSFAFAAAATAVEDYEGAIAALERMLLIRPDLPRVRLELGVLYFRLGSFQQARNYLQSVGDSPEVPQQVRERVQTYMAEVDKRLSPHKISGALVAGLRYDTNANSAATMTRIVFSPIDLPSPTQPEADSSAYLAASAEHVYDFQSQDHTTWESTALYYGARYRELKDVNLNYVDLTTGPRFQLPKDWLDQASWRPYALFTLITVGGEPYSYAPGGGLNLRNKFSDDLLGDLSFESRRRNYHVSADRAAARLQDGSEHQLRTELTYQLDDTTRLVGGLGWVRETARVGYNARRELNGSVGASKSYAAPFGLGGQPWTTSGTVTRAHAQYDDPDPIIDPGIHRHDRDWRVTLTTTVPVDDQWALLATIGRTVRDSNLPNNRYENTSLSFGAMWQF